MYGCVFLQFYINYTCFYLRSSTYAYISINNIKYLWVYVVKVVYVNVCLYGNMFFCKIDKNEITIEILVVHKCINVFVGYIFIKYTETKSELIQDEMKLNMYACV